MVVVAQAFHNTSREQSEEAEILTFLKLDIRLLCFQKNMRNFIETAWPCQ